ncbi:MAG: MBL fold metallo-hydrolase [Deltaproteobacteria bacterium]|nr:MBL fold metallo-hydrolase [Deltaproteobacteria bacterium]
MKIFSKSRFLSLSAAAAIGGLVGASGPVWSQTVKITPLGSHDGEFCRNDRAMVFEDPDGTRILYDAGRTVRGPEDPRLGNIEGVLLSHVHSDHLGDRIPVKVNEGTCAAPKPSMKVTPNSNTVNIVVGKKAKFFVGGEMNSWFSKKVPAAGGDAKQILLVRFGGMRELGGVSIYSVPAVHSNGIDPDYLDGNLAKEMEENGLTAYVGPPGGYVLKFSNGLVIYLSGDTGITAEQDAVVRRFLKADLVVMNIGGIFSTGPQEAAFVINDLVKPKAVIASHANEEATKAGKLVSGSKTETFIKHVKVPVHLPLSGKTMEFDGNAKCVKGCGM